jgi:hypothetical protein
MVGGSSKCFIYLPRLEVRVDQINKDYGKKPSLELKVILPFGCGL